MSDGSARIAIGELARRTGSTTATLRYYERVGILPPGERAGGRRHYPSSCAERVALIRLCQDAGFTLAEIRELLAAGTRRQRWQRLAEGKIAELDAHIAEAQRARELLVHGLHCPHRDLVSCPNFRAELQGRLQAASAGDEKSRGVQPGGTAPSRSSVRASGAPPK